LVEIRFIVILPAARPVFLNKSRTALFRQWRLRRIILALRLCDFPLRDYVPVSVYNP
jgi:hypothetical protein